MEAKTIQRLLLTHTQSEFCKPKFATLSRI